MYPIRFVLTFVIFCDMLHLKGGAFMVISNLPVLFAERGLSITKVFEDTGISRTTLTSLMRGKASGIHFDTINTLCRYLRTQPGQIFLFAPLDIDFQKIGAVVPGSVSFASDSSVSFKEEDTFCVLSEWGEPGKSCTLAADVNATFAPATRTLRADVAFTLPEGEGASVFLGAFSQLPRPFLSQIEHDFALTHAGLADPLREIRKSGKPKKGDIIPSGVDPMDWLEEKSKYKVSYNITWPKELSYLDV